MAAREPRAERGVERLIGSLRREFLDVVIVSNEWHLKRRVRSSLSTRYRNKCSPRQGLLKLKSAASATTLSH